MTRRKLDIDFDGGSDERVDVDLPWRGPDGTPGAETLTIYADPGLAVVTSWVSTRDRDRYAVAVALPVFVDDDGLPHRYLPPLKRGKVDTAHADYDARYADPAQWSSRRRFMHLVNDDDRRVSIADLHKLLDTVVQEATGGRPTGRSARS